MAKNLVNKLKQTIVTTFEFTGETIQELQDTMMELSMDIRPEYEREWEILLPSTLYKKIVELTDYAIEYRADIYSLGPKYTGSSIYYMWGPNKIKLVNKDSE